MLLILNFRLVLSAVFILAAVGKLLDLRGSREAMRAFGLPDSLAKPAGTALPFVELVLALLLLPGETAWFGALGVLALLLLFIAGISYNLLRGRYPECHCFGQLGSAPIGRRTLARNGVMVLLAAYVVLNGPQQIGPIDGLTTFLQAEGQTQVMAVLLLILPVALLIVLMPRRSAATAPDTGPVGLEPGSIAPAFSLPDVEGNTVTLDSLLSDGKPLLLIFTDPSCKPCRDVYASLGDWQREYGARLKFTLISRGQAVHNQQIRADYDLDPMLLQQDREVAEAYRAYGTPGGVLILPDAVVGSYVERGAEAIEHLLAQTAEKLLS